MTTVTIHMPEQSGQTGLSLYMRKTSDGTLLNTGGDALTEAPASSGRFTTDVAELWTETLAAAVVNGSSLTVRDGWLAAGSTIVVDAYPVDIASLQEDIAALSVTATVSDEALLAKLVALEALLRSSINTLARAQTVLSRKPTVAAPSSVPVATSIPNGTGVVITDPKSPYYGRRGTIAGTIRNSEYNVRLLDGTVVGVQASGVSVN